MNMEQPNDESVAFYMNPEVQYSWNEITYNFLGSSMIRIAVFVNIARWALLYLSMQNKVGKLSELTYERSKFLTYLILSIFVALQFTAVALQKFAKVDNGTILDDILDFWNYYMVAVAAVIFYTLIYFLIRRYYMNLI